MTGQTIVLNTPTVILPFVPKDSAYRKAFNATLTGLNVSDINEVVMHAYTAPTTANRDCDLLHSAKAGLVHLDFDDLDGSDSAVEVVLKSSNKYDYSLQHPVSYNGTATADQSPIDHYTVEFLSEDSQVAFTFFSYDNSTQTLVAKPAINLDLAAGVYYLKMSVNDQIEYRQVLTHTKTADSSTFTLNAKDNFATAWTNLPDNSAKLYKMKSIFVTADGSAVSKIVPFNTALTATLTIPALNTANVSSDAITVRSGDALYFYPEHGNVFGTVNIPSGTGPFQCFIISEDAGKLDPITAAVDPNSNGSVFKLTWKASYPLLLDVSYQKLHIVINDSNGQAWQFDLAATRYKSNPSFAFSTQKGGSFATVPLNSGNHTWYIKSGIADGTVMGTFAKTGGDSNATVNLASIGTTGPIKSDGGNLKRNTTYTDASLLSSVDLDVTKLIHTEHFLRFNISKLLGSDIESSFMSGIGGVIHVQGYTVPTDLTGYFVLKWMKQGGTAVDLTTPFSPSVATTKDAASPCLYLKVNTGVGTALANMQWKCSNPQTLTGLDASLNDFAAVVGNTVYFTSKPNSGIFDQSPKLIFQVRDSLTMDVYDNLTTNNSIVFSDKFSSIPIMQNDYHSVLKHSGYNVNVVNRGKTFGNLTQAIDSVTNKPKVDVSGNPVMIDNSGIQYVFVEVIGDGLNGGDTLFTARDIVASGQPTGPGYRLCLVSGATKQLNGAAPTDVSVDSYLTTTTLGYDSTGTSILDGAACKIAGSTLCCNTEASCLKYSNVYTFGVYDGSVPKDPIATTTTVLGVTSTTYSPQLPVFKGQIAVVFWKKFSLQFNNNNDAFFANGSPVSLELAYNGYIPSCISQKNLDSSASNWDNRPNFALTCAPNATNPAKSGTAEVAYSYSDNAAAFTLKNTDFAVSAESTSFDPYFNISAQDVPFIFYYSKKDTESLKAANPDGSLAAQYTPPVMKATYVRNNNTFLGNETSLIRINDFLPNIGVSGDYDLAKYEESSSVSSFFAATDGSGWKNAEASNNTKVFILSGFSDAFSPAEIKRVLDTLTFENVDPNGMVNPDAADLTYHLASDLEIFYNATAGSSALITDYQKPIVIRRKNSSVLVPKYPNHLLVWMRKVGKNANHDDSGISVRYRKMRLVSASPFSGISLSVDQKYSFYDAVKLNVSTAPANLPDPKLWWILQRRTYDLADPSNAAKCSAWETALGADGVTPLSFLDASYKGDKEGVISANLGGLAMRSSYDDATAKPYQYRICAASTNGDNPQPSPLALMASAPVNAYFPASTKLNGAPFNQGTDFVRTDCWSFDGKRKCSMARDTSDAPFMITGYDGTVARTLRTANPPTGSANAYDCVTVVDESIIVTGAVNFEMLLPNPAFIYPGRQISVQYNSTNTTENPETVSVHLAQNQDSLVYNGVDKLVDKTTYTVNLTIETDDASGATYYCWNFVG